MIPVTKPFMPPLNEYQELVTGIWEREYLTNNGPLVKELEQRLATYFELENVLFLSNGTIALQIAIKALELEGEIITTPFSYVATTSSIVWEGCTPIFVDIDANTLNIDPAKIEDAITPKTTAILATHVFGNPCDIDAIQHIADKYQLKVIYDAAHCFGTLYKGKSVFEYGDVSTTSFHATKLFHTIEGGAVFTNDDQINHRMSLMRNFGHAGFDKFEGVGINGKNSEFHAGMGLCNFRHIDKILNKRKEQCLYYFELLEGAKIKHISIQTNAEWNYSYFPIIFESEEILLEVKGRLEEENIYPRRYFYPSLDTLEYVKSKKVSVSKDIAERILCLPLYHNLTSQIQSRICEIILDVFDIQKQ